MPYIFTTMDHILCFTSLLYIIVPSCQRCGYPVLYVARLCHKDFCFRVKLHENPKTDQKTDTRTSWLVSLAITDCLLFITNVYVEFFSYV